MQDFRDPIIPELAVPLAEQSLARRAPGPEPGAPEGEDGQLVYDESAPLEPIPRERIPKCPKCSLPLLPPLAFLHCG